MRSMPTIYKGDAGKASWENQSVPCEKSSCCDLHSPKFTSCWLNIDSMVGDRPVSRFDNLANVRFQYGIAPLDNHFHVTVRQITNPPGHRNMPGTSEAGVAKSDALHASGKQDVPSLLHHSILLACRRDDAFGESRHDFRNRGCQNVCSGSRGEIPACPLGKTIARLNDRSV